MVFLRLQDIREYFPGKPRNRTKLHLLTIYMLKISCWHQIMRISVHIFTFRLKNRSWFLTTGGTRFQESLSAAEGNWNTEAERGQLMGEVLWQICLLELRTPPDDSGDPFDSCTASCSSSFGCSYIPTHPLSSYILSGKFCVFFLSLKLQVQFSAV